MAAIDRIVVSCEHGGNRIPWQYAALFRGRRRLLNSHRGYDRGAMRLARIIARRFSASLHGATVSRLLVDPNRHPGNRSLFSEVTRPLAAEEKRKILARYYAPHRQGVESEVARLIAAGQTVLHMSVHSFTPVLNGRVRDAAVGLLYDPSRPLEKTFCLRWQQLLCEQCSNLRIRRNYPYRGYSDGLTAWLRGKFPPDRYLGIELELNYSLLDRMERAPSIRHTLLDTLASVTRHFYHIERHIQSKGST